MIYKVRGLLPRTQEEVTILEADNIQDARRYCEKNIKYFPKISIKYGIKSRGTYEEEVFTNDSYVDRCRGYIHDAKIGRIKRKARFRHRIIFENDVKVCFLIRYKRNEARICIIDAEDKDKVMALIRTAADCYRVKVHRGAFPMVYFRYNARVHTTLVELIFNMKRKGYMNFRDGNPYNYMKSNIIFSKVALTRMSKPTNSGYKGVCYLPNEKGNKKYVVGIYVEGKNKKIGRFSDPLLAAKAYDRAKMEMYGRNAAKNFPYEYYAAFEPIYIANVK